jgi:hypothetical protein
MGIRYEDVRGENEFICSVGRYCVLMLGSDSVSRVSKGPLVCKQR